MKSSCKIYSFLRAVRGNWRNAIFVSCDCGNCMCGRTTPCSGFLLAVDECGQVMDLAGFGHLLMLPVLQRPFPFCPRLLPSLFYIHACYLPFCSLIYPQSRFRHLGDKKASMTKGKTPVVHSCL